MKTLIHVYLGVNPVMSTSHFSVKVALIPFSLAVPQVEISLAERRIATLQRIAEEEAKLDQLVPVRFVMEDIKDIVDLCFRGNIPWIRWLPFSETILTI